MDLAALALYPRAFVVDLLRVVARRPEQLTQAVVLPDRSMAPAPLQPAVAALVLVLVLQVVMVEPAQMSRTKAKAVAGLPVAGLITLAGLVWPRPVE